jgi:hypothetical protein
MFWRCPHAYRRTGPYSPVQSSITSSPGPHHAYEIRVPAFRGLYRESPFVALSQTTGPGCVHDGENTTTGNSRLTAYERILHGSRAGHAAPAIAAAQASSYWQEK